MRNGLAKNTASATPLAKIEWDGIRLALVAKGLIIVVMAAYLIVSFDAPALYWPLSFVALFIVTALFQGWIAWSRPRWIAAQVLTVAIDAAALAVVIAVPNPWSGFDLPPQVPFRNSYFALLVIYTVSVGFAYRPVVALAAGVSGAAAWAAVSATVLARPETVGWEQLPSAGVTSADIVALIGQTHFFSYTERQVEVIVMLLSAVLVAGLVWRSRRQIRRILKAERERERAWAEQAFVREAFGKYVPDAVVTTILSDRGRLTPQRRSATVLFADIEGFTSLGEKLDADAILTVLNAYFDAAGQVITAHGGTINQFQGDAILASFNVPVADPDHASNAVLAAKALLHRVGTETFGGEKLGVRIGVHTGDLAAGAVGGGDRLSYTVHGNTVNIAARLEQLNKTTRTRVLLSMDTAAGSNAGTPLRQVGEFPLSGLSEPLTVYTLADNDR